MNVLNEIKPLTYQIKLNWRNEFIKKADTIVDKYKNIMNKYDVIDESIDYFYGVLENCIYLLKNYENYSGWAFIGHYTMDEINYFNPGNLLIDVKERDMSNMIKYLFFTDNFSSEDLVSLLNGFNKNLIYIRCLYPDYYFYLVDNIADKIDVQYNLNKIEHIINKVSLYEELLDKLKNVD